MPAFWFVHLYFCHINHGIASFLGMLCWFKSCNCIWDFALRRWALEAFPRSVDTTCRWSGFVQRVPKLDERNLIALEAGHRKGIKFERSSWSGAGRTNAPETGRPSVNNGLEVGWDARGTGAARGARRTHRLRARHGKGGTAPPVSCCAPGSAHCRQCIGVDSARRPSRDPPYPYPSATVT